jgi:heme-degrading monooxygenase HmoA
MNRVCIITTKIPKVSSVNFYSLIEYQNELSTFAKTFPGYLDSVSYWKQNNNKIKNTKIMYNKICNISNWESRDDWNNWFLSDTRYKIQKKYIDSFENENHDLLYQRYNFSDTPLL